MRTEDELEMFYENKLKTLLAPLEHYRYRKLKKLKRSFFGIFFCFPLIIIVSFSNHPFFIFLSCIPMISFFTITGQRFRKMSKNLTIKYKCQILPVLLDFLFDHCQYIPRQKIAKSVLNKSMLMPRFVYSAQGEDFMRFRIGKTNIMFCETIAFSGKNKPLFNGLFISASFNKNFKAKTFVIPETLSNFFQTIKRRLLHRFKLVKLENVEFEKEFIIYSDDQVESRYILTPGLMHRILEYKNKVNKKISFSFVANRMYCTIPKHLNLFEPALFEPLNFEHIKKSYYPLKLYTDIVEDLNLNLRIWSK